VTKRKSLPILDVKKERKSVVTEHLIEKGQVV